MSLRHCPSWLHSISTNELHSIIAATRMYRDLYNHGHANVVHILYVFLHSLLIRLTDIGRVLSFNLARQRDRADWRWRQTTLWRQDNLWWIGTATTRHWSRWIEWRGNRTCFDHETPLHVLLTFLFFFLLSTSAESASLPAMDKSDPEAIGHSVYDMSDSGNFKVQLPPAGYSL